ncbi:MAG: DNA translocase FtsK [Bacteroidetes bacterium]|nr:DNA translocase FtsK [Bacteroidota bacterium]
MARKKENSRNKKSGQKQSAFSGIIGFFKDERVRYILAFITLFFAVYSAIAFTSYFISWKTDQSKLDIPTAVYIADADINVENWTGKYGALLANRFIHEWFGIASFSFVFLLVLVGFRLFKIRLLPLRKSVKFVIIITIWLSIALSFVFGDSYFNLGGAHGYFICSWLNSLLGRVGTAFLLIAVLIVFIILTFDRSIIIMKKVFTRILNYIMKKGDTGTQPEDIHENETGTSENDEAYDSQPVIIDLNTAISDTSEQAGEPVVETETAENQEEDGLELTIEDRTEENDMSDEISSEPLGDYDPTLDLSSYTFPHLDLLTDHKGTSERLSKEEWESELKQNKDKIVETLGHYKIEIAKISATIGPTVILYEIVPAPGIRISKIKNLEDDIALSLSALGIRIIAPMPGKGTIGIEVPNPKPDVVSMRSVIASRAFQECNYDLPIILGRTISNDPYLIDLTKMPHMLVAGATGQGKSVGINAIITSLLYKKHPSQIKFIMVDPKKVELSIYSKIEKHFLAKLPDQEEPIITDTRTVVRTLNSLCLEMDDRYDLLKAAGVRNIKEYNAKFIKRRLNPEKGHRFLPFLIVIIDEFADLIMTAGKEIEMPIARLAQLARAIGIHLIIATQRPSTNIITGTIKANFPSRVAFKVTSMIDSRTILDTPGANQLIGRGDFLITKGSDLVRVQCAFIDTPEVDDIVRHISEQQAYPTAFLLPEYMDENETGALDVDLGKRDPLFEDAARLLVIHQQGSTSLIQRKFSIGYNRAGKIIDQLEAAGIVGTFLGSKAREVIFKDEYSLEQFLNNLNKE